MFINSFIKEFSFIHIFSPTTHRNLETNRDIESFQEVSDLLALYILSQSTTASGKAGPIAGLSQLDNTVTMSRFSVPTGEVCNEMLPCSR